MQGNLTASSRVALAAAIAPQQAAVGTITTGWVDMKAWHQLLALVHVGTFGAGATIDAKIEQATDATGAGAKDVTGRAITRLVAAGGNNRQVMINLSETHLDKSGFAFVRLSVTVGTAASQLSATLLGLDPRYGRASANQATSVAEIIR